MKINLTLTTLTLIASVLLTSCAGATATPAAEMPHEEISTPDEMMADETPTADAMPQDPATPAETAMQESQSPAWFAAALTDVRTGQTFSLADFKGKVVLVETMAVWCSKCLAQQREIQSLHNLLGEREDFVSVSLDIDPYEDAATLQGFLQQTGFGWTYAVATPDVARAIAQEHGDQFLNPPSTPLLIVDRHGVPHPLPFGIKSAQDLLQAVQPYLDESM